MIATDPDETVKAAAVDEIEDENGAPSMHAAATDAERRYLMIAEAAFFLAEARGFEPGWELDDWLAAEREIDRQGAAAPE